MCQPESRSTLTVLLTCVLGIAGCGGGGPTQAEQQLTSNMQGLANAYGQCTSQNRGRPPRNEAQLRKFIESLGPDWLQQYQAELSTISSFRRETGSRTWFFMESWVSNT